MKLHCVMYYSTRTRLLLTVIDFSKNDFIIESFEAFLLLGSEFLLLIFPLSLTAGEGIRIQST